MSFFNKALDYAFDASPIGFVVNTATGKNPVAEIIGSGKNLAGSVIPKKTNSQSFDPNLFVDNSAQTEQTERVLTSEKKNNTVLYVIIAIIAVAVISLFLFLK